MDILFGILFISKQKSGYKAVYYCNTPTFLSKPLVPGAKSPGDIDQAKVGDDGTPILQENILCLEILVDNAPVVEVAHALGYLLCD